MLYLIHSKSGLVANILINPLAAVIKMIKDKNEAYIIFIYFMTLKNIVKQYIIRKFMIPCFSVLNEDIITLLIFMDVFNRFSERGIRMNKGVKIKHLERGRVATIKCKSSFKELDLFHEQINKWIEDNDFKIAGNCYFKFDPEHKDLSSNNILFELGIPVKNRSKDKNLVTIAEIPEHDVISALYKGSYFNLPSVHGILEDYARKNYLAPFDSPTEIYLNDPLEVKSSELLTEVRFTVFDFKPEDIPYVPLVNKIERKVIKKQKMVIIEHYGCIEDVYKVRVDLINWAEKRNIKVDALYFKHYLDPNGLSPRRMIFKVGLPVSKDFKKEDDIKIVEVPEHEVLSAVYKGPYINLPNVTRMMVNYAFENDLELTDFSEEIYLNSIFDVGCDDLLTEVRMEVVDFKFDKNIQLEKEIEVKTIKKHEIASIKNSGFEKINKTKVDLFNWIEKNNIKPSGHNFLRFHNHPRSLSHKNIYYEVGIPLDSNVEDVIKVIDYPKRKILSLTHKGSISALKDTHDFIKNYAKENELEPLDFPINLLVNKTFENNEDELLVEVQLLVKI